jgi:hypothetical protein
MKTKDLYVQISQVVYVFAIAPLFAYFFTHRLGTWFWGSIDGPLSFSQRVVLVLIAEAGLLIGSAYATLLWICTMKFFLTPREIHGHLEEPYVPLISEAVQKIFEFVFHPAERARD